MRFDEKASSSFMRSFDVRLSERIAYSTEICVLEQMSVVYYSLISKLPSLKTIVETGSANVMRDAESDFHEKTGGRLIGSFEICLS